MSYSKQKLNNSMELKAKTTTDNAKAFSIYIVDIEMFYLKWTLR
jgi:hypothetical protein